MIINYVKATDIRLDLISSPLCDICPLEQTSLKTTSDCYSSAQCEKGLSFPSLLQNKRIHSCLPGLWDSWLVVDGIHSYPLETTSILQVCYEQALNVVLSPIYLCCSSYSPFVLNSSENAPGTGIYLCAGSKPAVWGNHLREWEKGRTFPE